MRQHGSKIHRQTRRPHAALGPQERVDFAQLAFGGNHAPGSPFETRHRIPEIGALNGLLQKVIGTHPHRLNHRLPISVVIRHDHIKIRHGLLEPFQ